MCPPPPITHSHTYLAVMILSAPARCALARRRWRRFASLSKASTLQSRGIRVRAGEGGRGVSNPSQREGGRVSNPSQRRASCRGIRFRGQNQVSASPSVPSNSPPPSPPSHLPPPAACSRAATCVILCPPPLSPLVPPPSRGVQKGGNMRRLVPGRSTAVHDQPAPLGGQRMGRHAAGLALRMTRRARRGGE